MSSLRTTIVTGIRAAIGSMRRSPLRSLILLQGVIWATVIGVLPPAILRGSKEGALQRAEELGTDRVLIYEATSKRALQWSSTTFLRSKDWPAIRSVSTFGHRPPLLLVDSHTPGAIQRTLIVGRWFREAELRSPTDVCLISTTMALERFGTAAALDRDLELDDGRHLRVIGIVERNQSGAEEFDNFGYKKDHPLHGMVDQIMEYMGVLKKEFPWLHDERLVIAPAALDQDGRPDLIIVRARPDAIAELVPRLRRELVKRGVEPIIVANPLVQILFSKQMDTLERLHVVIFVICLMVGTIIVANTMILTILERKREIAVRRVEGATMRLITLQIMVETGAYCMMGGLLGIPLAMLLAWVRVSLDPSGSLLWMFPVREVIQTLGVITLFGTLGGILPALRAAQVQPARVLASE